MFCFCSQKLADISCCYLPVQLNRADILHSVVSMVELTLTLLEVPSLAVVSLVEESEGNSCCTLGTMTEIGSNLNHPMFSCYCFFFVVVLDRFFFFGHDHCDENDKSIVCDLTYLHVFAQRLVLL